MKIAVLANDIQWHELTTAAENIDWIRFLDEQDFFNCIDADIFINLYENAFAADYSTIKKPVLINSVSNTLKEINAVKNISRINGWNGFLSRPCWEIAGTIDQTIKDFFSTIKKVITTVPDEPGMIAPRIISMIINEAYFSLDEKLSTKEEIDTAMKLGVNYPYGPFEWCDKIGVQNIYTLLQKLSITDKRYLPSPLLQKHAKNEFDIKY
jgi:3-hydroxybutyryl-CoA dehydrogenase